MLSGTRTPIGVGARLVVGQAGRHGFVRAFADGWRMSRKGCSDSVTMTGDSWGQGF